MQQLRIFLFLACGLAAACTGPNRILRGGAPCDPLWDRIDYKKCYEENRKLEQLQQRPASPAEEQAEEQEDDIIGGAVDGHSGGHHGHR